MKPNVLRQKLESGEPTVSTHIHSTWPSVIEAVGHAGVYDYVEFVAEYGPSDLHDLDNMARAAELFDMGMMIKVDQSHQAYLAQRAVGSGFGSVAVHRRPFSGRRARADPDNQAGHAAGQGMVWSRDPPSFLHGLRRIGRVRQGSSGYRSRRHDREKRRRGRAGRESWRFPDWTWSSGADPTSR